MKAITDIDLIQKYLDKDLSNEEEQVLQNRIEQDADFKVALELAIYRNVQEKIKWKQRFKALRTQEKAEGKEVMTEVLEKEDKVVTKTKSPSRYWLKMAALVLGVLLTLTWVTYFYTTVNQTDYLVTEYLDATYKPMPDFERSTATAQSAIKTYQNGEYKKTIQDLENLQKEQKLNEKEILMLGASYLYIPEPNYTKAFEQFKQITKEKYADHAEWYKSLCLYQLGEKEEAKKVWEQIADNENHRYNKKAKKFIKD